MRLGPRLVKSKKSAIGTLRKTQLVTTFAPGAIADMPDCSVILAATNYWSNYSPVIHEPNLERLLGIKGFREPYATESDNPKGNPDVPAFRFPRMHFCPKCGSLKDYKMYGDKNNRKCSCGSQIVPSRFVCACINGHLEDFPYKWWVHYGNYSKCPDADRWDKLSIKFNNTTGGLSSIVIKCNSCGKERTMEGCMSSGALTGYKCRGKRPWIGFDNEFNEVEECNAPMKTLQRGASNVYFGITQSALTIPPYSQKLQSDISEKWEEIRGLFDHKMDDNNLKIVLKTFFNRAISEGRYGIDEYLKAAKERYQLENHIQVADIDEVYTEQMLYEDEYNALCAGYEQDNDDIEPEQFVAVESEIPEILDGYVDSIMLVKRLREVLAVKGFRRITPEKPTEDDNRAVGMNKWEYQPVWNKPLDWLPAIQMRGEGIFIKFDEDSLQEWEDRNSAHYNVMKERLGELNIGKGMMSARYVVLHTFAHLLIRQLTLECGYSGAALKERIYSTFYGSEKKMSGVLIYTSSSDSDGSLGGLVRQGEPELLETTVRNMLQEASWCSSDPLCCDSTAQGFYSLNYAACHACTLLPETSCEARNCLLDRVSIVGKYDDRSMGYFGELLEEDI
ncbi:DUF1998 domain-containing protein [Anaerovibrio lipolyticus]|uniref:DUF1998 domain-containing protein n=1 Tax=Anaerovibrio lipolyticus TaxID=82374 RepID=UPI0025D43386|nr:DUF1998 domain-containing protein [Anaerovibrio lipolyticus]